MRPIPLPKSRTKARNRKSRKNHSRLLCALLAGLASLMPGAAPSVIGQSTPKPAHEYLVYVLSESADRISLVRFGPKGAVVDHDLHIGEMPTDINGPHGIAIAPDKRTYYVSVSHGRPFGPVWKYSAENDRVLGKVTLGFFPATMDINHDSV